jgi:hypothetical protein
MRKLNCLNNNVLCALGLMLAILFPVLSWADGGGGGGGETTGGCRITVDSHIVQFSIYQPQIAGTTSFCNEIPETGSAILVFDYDGKTLRSMNVSFEVTKKSDGTRLYYQEPAAHPNGTVNATINFTEPGDYEAHVTLVHEGHTVDEHLPFSVGESRGPSISTYLVIGVVAFAVLYIFYLSNASFKAIVDRLLKKPS